MNLAAKIYERYFPYFRHLPKRMRFKKGGDSINGLIDLVRLFPKNPVGVEIGSFAGESAVVFICAGVQKLYCIDPWCQSANYATTKIEPAEKSFNGLEKVSDGRLVKMKGYSRDMIPVLVDAGIKVDFVYIDGNHSFAAVCEDIALAVPIIKAGGYICGHDYGRPNHNHEVTTAVNERLGKPDRVFSDHSWAKKL